MEHLPTQAAPPCQHGGAEITAPGGIIVVKKRLLIAAAVFHRSAKHA